MMYLLQIFQRFSKEEKGQALTEYGLIIGLIAVALIAALLALSGALGGIFESITGELAPGGE
jgi:pilus assembly protein Flp/PilA